MRKFILFDLANLLDAMRVSPAIKAGREPGADNLLQFV